MSEYMYIDEVANRTGLTPRTMRFWEEKGLLPPPVRTEGGIRLYSEADITRLIRIREMRDLLGLSLGVISELVKTESEVDQLRAQARQLPKEERIPFLRQEIALLEAQVHLMSDRMARLQNLQQSFEERLGRLRRRMAELENTAGQGDVAAQENAAAAEEKRA